ncbi:MAG: hypothetical protein ACJA1B_000839 [Polaribacter sp.]|jgi:hypothetical protein
MEAKKENTVLEKISATINPFESISLEGMNAVYFDNFKVKFYFDHHNGRVHRTKIRQRKYVDSDLTFLEVKQKNGKGETNKSRIRIPDFDLDLSQELKE